MTDLTPACSCGEKLPPTSGPSHTCKRLVLNMGDWQHAVTNQVAIPQVRPYCCPVCQGRGTVPAGFYHGISASTNPEQCKSCAGSGVLWA
jgi:hypothetical protein